MEDRRDRSSEGSCIISEEVIATIASTATMEVEGVTSMALRPGDLRSRIVNTATRSVKVTNGEAETVLDVYVNLKLGAKIQQVCGEIQQNVKSAVQSMTGKEVNRINVHVMGLTMDNEPTEKA